MAHVAERAAWRTSPEGRAAEAWWRDRLAGTAAPDIPPRAPGHAGPLARRTEPRREPVEAARRLADRLGREVSSVLLAAWVAALARYCGTHDITVGVPTQGPHPIGPADLDLAVGVGLHDDPAFGDLVVRVDEAWREARARGPVPPRVLADLTGPGRAPVLPVRFAAGPPCATDIQSGPLTWAIREPAEASATADLTLRADIEGTALWLEYAGGREAAAAGRLLAHVGELLCAGERLCAADPPVPVSRLPMLTVAERAELVAWNDTAAAYPGHRCLHELIETQADATPYAAAVTAHGVHLTYRDLDRRANRLAHLLRDRGVGPDTLVGVLATRRVATIAAMLAVLKAGGAYVPLDPDYPPERLARICGDAHLRLVLAEPDRLGDIPSGPSTVASDEAPAAGFPPDRPAVRVHPDNLAYVIYTSGSTGRPKGVLVPHRQIVHSTAARWAGGRFSPGAYAPPVPLSFDASCAAIYWSLCRGGRLVLPTDAEARDPRLFAKLIKDENITHITGMPSFYALVLSAGHRALRTLRDASIGGEAMPPEVAAEHRRTLPLARLYNDYGPTEGTVWSTVHPCRGDETGASVPIGRPIQNVRVHVLDEYLNPVPVGVPGQLAIAGDGLARGYLGQPALTAERFTPDPFGAPGGRMYLTGDRCVRRPDGEVQFLGRLHGNAQVKVRGFRVELAEVETALHEHPAVAVGVVAPVTRGPGDTRLTAHLVPRDPERPPEPVDVEMFLRERLPDYMIPGRFVLRAAMPVTASGKIDRAALAAEEPSAVGAGPDALRRLVDELDEAHLNSLLDGLLSQATTSHTERRST